MGTKMRMGNIIAGSILLIGALTLSAEVAVKVAEKPPPKELDASIAGTLQPKAIQVTDGDKPRLEIWLRKEIPVQSKPTSAEKALEGLKQATLIGAVHVPAETRDYRDDQLAAGIYTMRFALQPQDGNHLGSSEFLYFAVLTPAKLDTKLDGIADYKQLVKASSKETSTDHPVILSLRPPSKEAGENPTVVEPAPEHKSILLKATGKMGPETVPLPFEVVFEGKGHK